MFILPRKIYNNNFIFLVLYLSAWLFKNIKYKISNFNVIFKSIIQVIDHKNKILESKEKIKYI